MPELPEVNLAIARAARAVAGRRVVWVRAVEAGGHARDGQVDEIVLRGVGEGEWREALVGATVVGHGRRGKHCWLSLSSSSSSSPSATKPNKHVLFHFGMTGMLRLRGERAIDLESSSAEQPPDVWPPRFTKIMFGFATTTTTTTTASKAQGDEEEGVLELAFTDPRRLGRVAVVSDPLEELRALAPDALTELPPAEQVQEALRKCGGAMIKPTLLDQGKVVSGVGNWVADDVLLAAGIHPETSCADVAASLAATKRLREALRHVVSVASERLLSGEELPKEWLIHSRWGSAPPPGGAIIKGVVKSVVGGRATFVVPAKQPKRVVPDSDSDHPPGPEGHDGSESAAAASARSRSTAPKPPKKRVKSSSS